MARQACAALGVFLLASAVAAQPLQLDRNGSHAGVGATAAATVGCGESWQVVTRVPTSRSLLANTWAGTQFVAVGAPKYRPYSLLNWEALA